MVLEKLKDLLKDQKWFTWITIIDFTYMNIIIFSALQLKHWDTSSFWLILSDLLALLLFIGFSAYPFILLSTLDKGYRRKNEIFMSKFGKCFPIFKKKKGYLFLGVILARKYLFSLILVFLQEMPTLQMLLIWAMNTAYVVVLMKSEPYKQ